MNYEKIAEGVVRTAVQNHLREEITEHTRKLAREAARRWLAKNKTKLQARVTVLVEEKLNAALEKTAERATNSVMLKLRGEYD